MGTGFLWEMHFYSSLLHGLLEEDRNSTDVANAALSNSNGLLIWDDRATTSSRDVASYIKRLVSNGSCCMSLIANLNSKNETLKPKHFAREKEGLVQWVDAARSILDSPDNTGEGTTWRSSLAAGLARGPSSGSGNTYETIRYALLCRDPFGKNADYYGLMRKRGTRYTVVSPSTEWLVVIASLAAAMPGDEVHLEDVIQALDRMGLKPDYTTLINEVERAGLGRGSHDADEAISIATAFS